MSFQLGATMLDALVLAIVNEEDTYGYSISQQIKQVVDLKESTLYPVLKRLQEVNYLTSYDQAYQGRNRRYYQITPEGVHRYDEYINEWDDFKTAVERILIRKERDNNE